MGLSATQARFLQLTGRKNDIEYQAQQISQQRLMLSNQMTQASDSYNNKISNKKLVFNYADITAHQVDITYGNYKNFMNQQLEGLQSSQQKLYLVSSSGKIVVQNKEEMYKMIENSRTYVSLEDIEAARTAENPTPAQQKLIDFDWSECVKVPKTDKNGNETEYYIQSQRFSENDFVFVEGLDDADYFQNAIKQGVYFFATLEKDETEEEEKFAIRDWSTVANGAIMDKDDESDDAAAEAEYKRTATKIQSYDKKLELILNGLETERDALKTELEAINNLLKDEVKSFNTFNGRG